MRRQYRPRRATARWLEGAPAEVLDVFDAPKYVDRYTVLLGGPYLLLPDDGEHATPANVRVQYRALSERPNTGRGVFQTGEMPAYEAATYRRESAHRRIKWSDLPENVQLEEE